MDNLEIFTANDDEDVPTCDSDDEEDTEDASVDTGDDPSNLYIDSGNMCTCDQARCNHCHLCRQHPRENQSDH